MSSEVSERARELLAAQSGDGPIGRALREGALFNHASSMISVEKALRAIESALSSPPIDDEATQGDRDAAARQKPVPYAFPAPGKVIPCMVFDAGSLNVYQQGYGEHDGDGYFVFRDEVLDWEQEEGTDYRIAKVDNSDLLFLRDQLNKLFPPALSSLKESGR